MAATRDIHRHMLEQMAELEVKKKKQEELDQEMLKQRIIQDQKVLVVIIINNLIACNLVVSQSATRKVKESKLGSSNPSAIPCSPDQRDESKKTSGRYSQHCL